MKLRRVVATIAMLVVVAPLVQAQTRTSARKSAGVRPPKKYAPTNIAVINTDAFLDQKVGINRMLSALQQLNAKYQPVAAELRGMRKRVDAMRLDIQKNKGIQEPQWVAQQTAEADGLDLQIKRKGEEAEANYLKDRVALFDPVNKDLTNALNGYAQAKGITLLLDINKLPVLFSAPHVNITKDFIAEYNRTHPVIVGPSKP